MRYSIYLAIIICLGISSCAYTPELSDKQIIQINELCKENAVCLIEQTNKAKEIILEEREYDRQVREDLRIEKWRATVAWCNQQSGMSMWYTYRSMQTVNSRRTGIPDRHTSYGCANTADTMRRLQRGY